MAEVDLQQAEGAVPQVVEAEGDAGLLNRPAILQPDGDQVVKRPGVGDALQPVHRGALDHAEPVFGRGHHNGRRHVHRCGAGAVAYHRQVAVTGGLLLTQLGVGSLRPVTAEKANNERTVYCDISEALKENKVNIIHRRGFHSSREKPPPPPSQHSDQQVSIVHQHYSITDTDLLNHQELYMPSGTGETLLERSGKVRITTAEMIMLQNRESP